jgi:hypothetical protein
LIFKGDIGERINQLMIKEREVNPIARDTLQNDKLQAMTKERDIYNTNNEPQNPNEVCTSHMSNSLNNPASIDSMMFSEHNKNKSGDLNSDCSTLQELEDFIEQSFQNAFNSSVNDSILLVQTTDCSTPVQPQNDENNSTIERRICYLKF